MKEEFDVLRELIQRVAGAELPPVEREAVKTAALAALNILEKFASDIGRIADAVETIASPPHGG